RVDEGAGRAGPLRRAGGDQEIAGGKAARVTSVDQIPVVARPVVFRVDDLHDLTLGEGCDTGRALAGILAHIDSTAVVGVGGCVVTGRKLDRILLHAWRVGRHIV